MSDGLQKMSFATARSFASSLHATKIDGFWRAAFMQLRLMES